MLITSAVYALAGLSFLIMGLETFRSERRQKANILFFLSCGSLALWSGLVAGVMLSETVERALAYRQFAVLFWSFAYSFYLHFIIVLTMSDGRSGRNVSVIRTILKTAVIYTPSVFSIYLYYFKEPSTLEEMVKIPLGWAYLNLPRNLLWDNYFLVFYLVYIIASIFALMFWKRRSTFQRVKKMVNVIVWSTVGALVVGTITDFLLPLTSENPLPPLGVLVSLIPIIGVRVAITKYKILQLNPFGMVKDILRNMKEGLVLVNLNSIITEVNPEAEKLLGYKENELKGVPVSEIVQVSTISQSISADDSSEHEMITKSGELLPVMLTSETLQDPWGDPVGTMMLFRDVTAFRNIHQELKKSHDLLEKRVLERTSRLADINQNLESEIVKRIQMEEKIRSLSSKDQLTGLGNRRVFIEWLEKELFETRNSRDKLAVYCINIDAFSMVNNTFGHLQGDVLLKKIAEMMKAILGSYAYIARSEGDDFLVLRRISDEAESLFADVDLIRSVFKDPFILSGREITITATIGISIAPDDAQTSDSLIKNAEIAMAVARKEGHDQYEFFKPELKNSVNEEMQLSNDLYQAVEKEEFELYFQPQIDPLTARIKGMEALIRWNHPALGIISPGVFIPISERTTLILKIGEWVLRKACQQLRVWRDQGYTNLVIAVNVSIKQLANERLYNQIVQVLEETGIPASSLEIELTESVLIQKTSDAVGEISRIRNLGVQIAIDDFGTVFSSLNYLKMLSLDRLKIAREFVVGIGNSPVDEAIISSMIVLGRSMDLEIIGEGVETKEQLDFLIARSCDTIQGYYYSRPIPVDDMTALLESQ